VNSNHGNAAASIVFSAAFAANLSPATAQEVVLPEIVVTPSRNPLEQSKVGSTVETTTKKEIEEQSLPLVIDYLAQRPGVSVSSPGGPGSEGSLAIRGAARRYIKTLYNGIDIADPTSTQVQTSYQHLLAGNIDSIEVLKGSQSTLYGSDAIAGVISISTLGGIEPGIRHVVYGEGGSFGTARGALWAESCGRASGTFAERHGLQHRRHFSAAAAGSEPDGYENVTADINGEYRLSENFAVFASGLYINGTADFDNDGYFDFVTGDFVPPSDNLTAENRSRQLAGRAGFNLDFMDGRFKNTVSFQGFDLTREISGTFFDGTYTGTRQKADYHGTFEATEWLTIHGGGDYERQQATFPEGMFNPEIEADFSLAGIWAEAIVTPVEALTLTAGLRHDEHSEFGGHTTYRATGSYLFEEMGTRLHSSVGTGFRAPSLNELFGPFGANPDLDPETSFSFDAGAEQTLLGGALKADVTYFLLDIDNLIQYTNQYVQVPGTTRQRGVEASLSYAATAWMDLTGATPTRVPRRQAATATSAYHSTKSA
jgi:vitamin B12 transporter